MTQFPNLCGVYPINNQIIFFRGNEIHFGGHALIHMEHLNIQLFVLKVGNSANDQPNDNDHNTPSACHETL